MTDYLAVKCPNSFEVVAVRFRSHEKRLDMASSRFLSETHAAAFLLRRRVVLLMADVAFSFFDERLRDARFFGVSLPAFAFSVDAGGV